MTNNLQDAERELLDAIYENEQINSPELKRLAKQVNSSNPLVAEVASARMMEIVSGGSDSPVMALMNVLGYIEQSMTALDRLNLAKAIYISLRKEAETPHKPDTEPGVEEVIPPGDTIMEPASFSYEEAGDEDTVTFTNVPEPNDLDSVADIATKLGVTVFNMGETEPTLDNTGER